MDANTRHFEAELQAQHETAEQATAKVSPEANIVPATAL